MAASTNLQQVTLACLDGTKYIVNVTSTGITEMEIIIKRFTIKLDKMNVFFLVGLHNKHR